MTLKNFLILATIVAAVFGVALLAVPSQLVAIYGVKLTPATEVTARIAGSAILGFAVVFWGIRNENGAEALKAAMVAGFIVNGLDCLIVLHATATGLSNAYGWAQAALNGLLALGFAYFTFGKR